MKQFFKRMTAALLLICLLSTFVVPATFADTAQTVTTTYAFDFYNSYNNLVPANGNTALNADCSCGESHSVKDHLDGLYTTLNWKLTSGTTADFSNAVARAKNDQGLLMMPEYQGWMAVALNVLENGNYTISLKGSTQGSIRAYILEGVPTTDQITQKLADTDAIANNVLMSSVTFTEGVATSNEMALDAGEYTIVFKNVHRSSARNLYLETIELTKTVTEAPTDASTEAVVETQDQYVYPMDFHYTTQHTDLVSTNHTALSADCQCGVSHTVKAHLDTLYESLGWKFAGNTIEDYSNITARADADQGLLIAAAYQGWTAITLKTPAANTYKISLIGNGGQGSIAVYLFEGALDQTQIAEKMADTSAVAGNLMKSGFKSARDENAVIGEVEFTSDEYTMVFRNTHHSSARNLYLNTIQLDKVVEQESTTAPSTEVSVPTTEETVPTTQETEPSTVMTEPSTEMTVPTTEETVPPVEGQYNYVMDFHHTTQYTNLVDKSDNTQLSADCLCGASHTVKEHLDTLYGQFGWKFAGNTVANYGNVEARANKDQGLLFAPESKNWIAITLKAPQADRYTLSLIGNGGQGSIAVYLFEGALDQTQLEGKMADIGAVSGNLLKTNFISARDNRAVVGEVDVTAAEYTLVLYNTHSSKARNLFLSTIRFDKVVEVPEEPTQPPQPLVENVWNFDLYNTDPGYAALVGDKVTFSTDCGCGAGHTLKEHHDTLYATEGWKVAGTSTGDYDSVWVYKKNNFGTLFQPVKEGWIGITLWITKAGKQTLYATAGNTCQAGINTYIFEGELTERQIAEKMADSTSANNMISKGVIPTSEPTSIGSWDFTPGAYTLVFHNSNTTKARNLFLRKLELGEFDGVEPSKPTEPVACGGSYTEGTYNFALYTDNAFKPMLTNDKGNFADAGMNGDCYNCGKPLPECFAEQYASNQINWSIEASTFRDLNILASTYLSKGYGGLRMRYNSAGEETTDLWTAFRVKVAKAGTYTISFTKDYPYAYNADVYIFPATAETMSATEVEAAMTAENRVATLTFGKNVSSVTLGDKNLPAAGDYILVMKNVNGSKRIFVNGMTFKPVREPAPIDPVNKLVYDFDLMARDKTFEKKGITGRFTKEPLVYMEDLLGGMYEKGEINWKYELSKDVDSEKLISFRTGCLRWKSAGNFKEMTPWSAFRIKNPGTASYDIRITSSSTSSLYADIYLIPAPSQNMSVEAVEAAMTAENLLVKDAIINAKKTFYMGEYTFGMAEEYILILHLKKGAMLYLQNIQLTKDGLVADEEISRKKVVNGAVYDFDLTDQMDGIFEGVLLLKDIKKDIDSLYNSGALNWKWVDSYAGLKGSTKAEQDLPSKNHRFYPQNGMRIYATKDCWTAYKIKSPGSGTFTVTMNHAVFNKSGTVAVYVVPADTEDIWAATDSSNRIGKVNMSADVSSIKDGSTSFVGYWDFEAGKEYIIVLEAYENSLYSTHCYMYISQLICERGKIPYEDASEKILNEITVVEDALPVLDPGQMGALTNVNGHDYYILPCEGGAAMVYNLQTRELVDTFQTGLSRTLDAVTDKDGIVWIVGSSKTIIRYDPYTQEVSKLASFLGREGMSAYTGYYSVTYDYDNHRLYLGTYYGAGLACYDIESQEYTYLGQMAEAAMGTRGLCYHNGYVYYNVYNDNYSFIHKYDVKTNEVVAKCDVDERQGSAQYIITISVIDDEFLVCSGMNGAMNGDVTIDIDTMELMDTTLPHAVTLAATREVDGIYYFSCVSNGLYQYDTKTKEFSKVPGFNNTAVGMRSHNSPLITLNGDRCCITYKGSDTDGFRFFVYNLDKQTTEEWMDLEVRDTGGAALRTPMNWEPGSNKMSFGAFNIHEAVVYDIVEGKIVDKFETRGQTDSQVRYKGKYYCGVYSSTLLNEIDTDTHEMTQRWKLEHDLTGQKRIHTLTAGDDKVFAGTIPDTDQYGGAIVVYDTNNAQWFYHRHVVQDQSIVKLVYHDKLVYGITGIYGGTGSSIESPKDTSAVIFIYDYEKQETIATLDPRDYISGLPSRVSFVVALQADPNIEENGRFWAVVSETLFTFTFDKETKKFDVQEVISFDKSVCESGGGRSLFARNIEFDTQRNYIYFSFDTKGGFQRLEVEDLSAKKIKVKSNMRLLRENPMGYTLGEDGNLYYTFGADLKLFPLNVTDEDWALAGKVDDMIASVADPVTLECEVDIKNARSAYDNLSWYYKTLIQNEEKLLEIETDLLECKIDTIVVEEVTADSLPALQELKDEYDGQNERQQRYTKNYDKLMEAYNKASALNDERIAAALQKRINDLKPLFPLTLDNESTVVAIRTDFDAMTRNQQALVDTTILLDAEAQIAALRAEFVKYVESLIQAIPKEITLEAEPAITAAREAADKLYALERKLVSYTILTNAEGKLKTLLTAKAAADETDALIKAIGIVTLGDKDRIAAARASYDALSEMALQFVTKGKKLQSAEFILKALQTWGIPVITVANAGIAFAVVWFVPSLHQKVFKGKKEEETPAGEEKESI